MKIGTGQRYDLIHREIPQGTPGSPPQVYLSDIFSMGTHFVVIGYKLAHQQRIYRRGVLNVGERPTVGGIVQQPRAITSKFVEAVGGLPWSLRQGSDEIDLINYDTRLKGINKSLFTGGTTDINVMIERTVEVLRLFDDWLKNNQQMPIWYMVGRQTEEEIDKIAVAADEQRADEFFNPTELYKGGGISDIIS